MKTPGIPAPIQAMLKPLVLSSFLAMLLAPIARSETIDRPTWWYGFYTGGAATICILMDGGYLSKNDAKEALKHLFQENENAPPMSSRRALDYVGTFEGTKSCPLPR